MYIEVLFRSASTDGLRKFIEAVQCPIDGVVPSFDSHHSVEGDSHLCGTLLVARNSTAS